MHYEFIAESRKWERNRIKKERDQLARTRRFQRRSAWALSGIAVAVLAGLVAAILETRDTQRREAILLTSLAQKAYLNNRYDKAIRIALQGLPSRGAMPWSLGWEEPTVRGLEAYLANAAILNRQIVTRPHIHVVNVSSANFTADDRFFLTVPYSREGEENVAYVWMRAQGSKSLFFEATKMA